MSLARFVLSVGAAFALFFSVQAMAVEDTSALNNVVATSSESNIAQKINLNTATVEQLDALKGVGASKAKAIVDYRTQHGPFKSVQDLASVKGFSAKTVATLITKNPNMIVVE